MTGTTAVRMLGGVLRVALAGLRARRLRSLLVAATVMLGVGVLGGTLVYGDTARAAFFDDLARGAAGVDVWAATGNGADPPLRGPAAVAAVAKVPGVAHVEARPLARVAMVGNDGRVVANGGRVGLAMAVPTFDGFAPYRTGSGRVPGRSGEAALDRPTAEREAIAVGARLRILDRAGVPHELTVVGIVDFGASTEYADSTVVVLSPADLAAYASTEGSPDLLVAGTPGTDQAQLAGRIAAVLGPGYTVSTGEEHRRALAIAAAKYVDSFLTTLKVASLVALAVALLVVYNTFQIVVAQRTREHALLRCVGAGRGQIIRLVVVEAALVGGVASVGSVLLGIGAGYALALGQDAFGRGLPGLHLVVSPRAVLVPLAAGILATVASALLPALAAGRVSPMAAVRDAAAPVRRLAWYTVAGAIAVAAAGLYVLEQGRGRGFDGLLQIVGGAMIVFCALVLLLPLAITTLGAPLRLLLGRAFGTTGALAVTNARRHPVRFAATTTALMVGIAPMTAFAILLTTAQTQSTRELAENFPIDFVVSHADQPNTAAERPNGFAAPLVARLKAAPELGVVAQARVDTALVDGSRVQIGTAEPGVLGSRLAVEVRTGSLAALASGTTAVEAGFAYYHHVRVGDTISVGTGERRFDARIVATYSETPVPADLLVNWSDFASAGLSGASYLVIRRADTATAAGAAAVLDRVLADDPLALVSSVADRRESLTDSLSRRLVQFDVLLGVSMVIAVLGIANALSLSVLERTRESAMLRAVGLGRRQMYGMLLVEALLTALLGAAIGVAFGVGLGWVAAHELIRAYGHGAPSIPYATVLAYVGIAIVGAALASLLPARRAARASIVAAIEP